MSVLECQWYEEEYQNMCRTKPSFFIRIVFSVAIIAFILGNFSYFVFTPNDLNVLDADRTDRDTTFLAVTPSGEVITHPFQTVDWNPEYNKIVEVDIQGHVVWECQGLAFPHELLQLPNGHILVANTGADNIVEIDYPNTNIVWTWNVADMDWSLVNPAWDADHYYNTPQEHDWSHINHVAFKQYDTWNACLISIRNFDMILELNYTEARFGDTYNPANIIWYYGDYGNYTMLRHQHNPDYTPNGNIIVADSHNSRIIEIDYATKEIVWDFSDQLQWCRDADIMQNGNVLITDSDEVMEVNYATKRIVWRYFTDMVVPYEADELPNRHILIGCGMSSQVVELNLQRHVVFTYNTNIIQFIWIGSFILGACMNFLGYAVSPKKTSDKALTGIFCIIHVIMVLYYAQVISGIFWILISSVNHIV